MSELIKHSQTFQSLDHDDAWVGVSTIEQSIWTKIKHFGKPLSQWNVKINRGVLTGYNDAFIIDEKTRTELLTEDPKCAELIRPILRGKDIQRYQCKFAGLYLIFVPWHFPNHRDQSLQGASQEAEKAFQKQYPAIYQHLLKFKEGLQSRNKAETGIRYEWYALQRWGSNYWEDFSKPKLVWKRIGSILRFCVDETQAYVLDSTCFAVGNDVHYLSGVFNSKMGNYLLQNSPKTGTGDLIISVQAISPIYIPVPSDEQRKAVDKIVAELEALAVNDTTNADLQRELNNLVYELYGLSREERDYIDALEIPGYLK